VNENVTPFRRPEKPKAPKTPLFDVRDPRSQVQLVHGLTITSFSIVFLGTQFVSWIGMGLGVAALVIAVSKRDEGVFWARSHFEFALRTQIIGSVAWLMLAIVGFVIGFIPFIGAPMVFIAKAAVLVWVIIRAGFAFLRGSDTKIIENPTSWLI
jgi:uncharacterized membrane protein